MTNKQTWRELYPPHPAAEAFPMLGDEELRELGEDMKKNGMREPIVLQVTEKGPVDKMGTQAADAVLLDGRNRLEARERHCPSVQLEARKLTDSRDPVVEVISRNIHRRHLTPRQRATIAVRLAKLGTNGSTPKRISRQVAGNQKTVRNPKGAGRSPDPIKQRAMELAPNLDASERTIERVLAADRKREEKERKAVRPANPRKRKETAEDVTVQGFARKLDALKADRLTRTGVDALVQAEKSLARIRGELTK